MSDIKIKSLDGKEFGGYMAMPAKGHGPGVVVIQEIFGVNEGMRSICDALAKEGYMAFCPDLFWRLEPNVQLTDKSQAEWNKALALMNAFDVEAGVRDLLSALGHLRRLNTCSGKVGAIGYCLGGKLAYLMAARSDADCTVSYYGVGLDAVLHEMPDIRTPCMLHIAEKDKFVTPDAQARIRAAAAKNPRLSVHSYPGVDHAFARPNGQNFDKAAAELANQRTMDFFAEHLMQ
jgi:carboxymethylenebutenolidase